jgi:Fe-S cluster assembly protein SufD
MTVLDRLVGDRSPDTPSRRWLVEHGWPRPRDEAWRYAPLAAITAAAGTDGDAPAGSVAQLVAGIPGGRRIVLVDGRYRSDLSTVPPAEGLVIELDTPPSPFRPDDTTDAFVAANHAAASGTTRIGVSRAGTRADTPETVHLVHLSVDGRMSHPRTEITLAPDAHLELIETFRAARGARLTNAVTRINVGAGARLDHVRVLQGALAGAHIGRTDIVANTAATIRVGTLLAGSGAIRYTVGATFAGADAAVTLTGLSVPMAGAHCDTAVSVLHRASGTWSRQRYVAIVPDHARASFTGRVVVAAGSTGTDSDQQNRNLLLGPTARADTRPWLQIDADDVACTHGATVGRLDGDGLFYLRSRGIPERAARAMLVAAFARAAFDDALAAGPGRDWLATSTTAAIDAVLDGETALGAGERETA